MGQVRGVLGVLATPRWVGWTVLAVLAVVVCGGMAYWQFLRAESPAGSLLNAGYALQWPVFGLFFAALWWRMLAQEARILDEVVRGGDGSGDGPDDDRSRSAAAPDAVAPGSGSSPFTPRPAGVLPGHGQGVPDRIRARTDYNAMLAELAAADRAERDGPTRETP